jgi:hypothetical protein
MVDHCYVWLDAMGWLQTVSRYPTINVEGRKLLMNARPRHNRELVLSNGKAVHDYDVHFHILTGRAARGDGTPLKRGFGLLSFHEAREGGVDYPPIEASIGGWVTLSDVDFDAVWTQVTEGRYPHCAVSLSVSPVTLKGVRWVWDIQTHRSLYVESAAIDFTRPVQRPTKPEEKMKKGWFARVFGG